MPSGLTALQDLRSALARVGDALAAGQPGALLACEPLVAEALAHLQAALPASLDSLDDNLRDRMRREVAASFHALRRCERLGASLTDVARAVLVAQGRAGGYDRDGQESFEARGGALTARG